MYVVNNLSTPVQILQMFDISRNYRFGGDIVQNKKLPQLQLTQAHLTIFPEMVPSLVVLVIDVLLCSLEHVNVIRSIV